jgi:hypothetical protein
MKALKLISLIVLFSIGFYACEKVEAPYKKAGDESERGSSGDTVKNVLLEDYTGHGCVNCPAAAEIAHDLKGVEGERLVIIAVHAGYWATSTGLFGPEFTTDFTCPAGNTWYDYFGFSTAGNPNGLIDRVEKSSGDYIITPTNWGAKTEEELAKDFMAQITIENNFNAGTNTLGTTIKTVFQNNLVGNYSLVACITQDSIIAAQKDERDHEDGIIEDYVHMHALRASLNGDWGENVSGGEDIVSGKVYEKNYSLKFEDEWVPKNCWVVAFVYDESNKTVIQVDEQNVKN